MGYYDHLGAVTVKFNENSRFGHDSKTFPQSEWTTTGDFLVIFQEKVKSVFPLVGIDEIYVD